MSSQYGPLAQLSPHEFQIKNNFRPLWVVRLPMTDIECDQVPLGLHTPSLSRCFKNPWLEQALIG